MLFIAQFIGKMKIEPEDIIVYSFLICIVLGVVLAYAGGIANDGMEEGDKIRIDYLVTTMLGYVIGRASNKN